MMGFEMGFGWFGFLLMAIFWIAFIAIVIWLFSNLFSQNKQTNEPPTPTSDDQSETAVTILKKRYARGEISKEEFETLRFDLEQ